MIIIPKPSRRVLSLRQHLPHRGDFDGIPQRRARAVRLVDVDLRPLEARLREHGAQQALLRGAVGRREAGGAAVRVAVALASRERCKELLGTWCVDVASILKR